MLFIIYDAHDTVISASKGVRKMVSYQDFYVFSCILWDATYGTLPNNYDCMLVVLVAYRPCHTSIHMVSINAITMLILL